MFISFRLLPFLTISSQCQESFCKHFQELNLSLPKFKKKKKEEKEKKVSVVLSDFFKSWQNY